MIDLRSDTVTLPTPEMRRAMLAAPLGDDVFGEDPTIRKLEEETAALLGKEAAVYVPSGTMANQIALRIHTRPGDAVILEGTSHIRRYEAGGAAALSGLTCSLLEGTRGLFTPEQVTAAVHRDDEHLPRSRLFCVENTHNSGGGTVWPQGRLTAVVEAARAAGLRCHLDGARLWNAAVASGLPEAELAAGFDTVSVCFSKGLGAPVGSALCASRALVHEARRVRKQFGGGMRQAGVIAAGALYALRHHRQRLAEDHQRARRLAETWAGIDGLMVEPEQVETNMVYFSLEQPRAFELQDALAERGLLLFAVSADRLRAVVHRDLDDRAIEAAGPIMVEAVAQFKGP